MKIVKQLRNRFFPAGLAKKKPLDTVLDRGEEASESSAMQKASSWWGNKAMEAQQQALPSSWAECPIILSEYIAPLISGPARQGWLETIAMEYFSQPVDQALSLGCGSGGLERHALKLNIARNIGGLDISAEAIEIASTLAKDSRQDEHIRYAVANLNELEFKPDVYDAAFASQSVHHIESLDHYMLQVRKALKPGALFVINDFVGPNQFQWTDTQVELAQQLLDTIPEKLKSSIRG
ncbi:MAG: class I SAM-dependent methyltransferase, partial [Proteobacteria bacterium]|nr:class I SAM-dependent methyltransferase [Pseudomonadota bacterium]